MAERGAGLRVADDNKVNRLLLARKLELLGHPGALGGNGRVALDKLRREAFDLVLLEMEMPEMTGFEVLEPLQADPALRDLPVVVTSSLEGEAHMVRCLQLGAEDVLKKPVNPVILRARIGSSLEKKRLRDQQKALISRFTASEVAQDLQAEGFSIRGQRLEVTVLFVDIRGFTTLTEQQSPEDTIELLNTYYTLMFEAITSQGGVVNQIIGDGLMALFGAPRPLPEAALCAVRCAQDMLDMIALLNAEREATSQAPLRIGVGIATGQAVAGYTGTQQRAIYTCIGDTVNVAARLEAHTKAAQRGVLMDAATAAAVAGVVTPEPLGAVQLKGKLHALEVFALAGSPQ
ncbi:MAG: adenylate/guanylate cyclase domain-containing protein [Rubrivivax sp.]